MVLITVIGSKKSELIGFVGKITDKYGEAPEDIIGPILSGEGYLIKFEVSTETSLKIKADKTGIKKRYRSIQSIVIP